MQPGMGTLDFFLLEAGDYLEQLDALAAAPAGTPPPPEDFLRLTRAFRGSALMANQTAMGRAAQGFESCARALREGRLAWDERIRGEITRAVDDCKILIRRLRTPEQGDTEKAEQIGAGLDRLSGRASAAMRAATVPGLDAGARAFVAREAAAIASTLQRTAAALAADPTNHGMLAPVVGSMSALRGVALIQDLPPLADLLAAVEAAVGEAQAPDATGSGTVAMAFDTGARALARAAREVVEQGRPDAESEEARTFAQQLLAAFTGGAVVPIESLFYADPGPHIVHEGVAPAHQGGGYDRVEMVSQGEFLTAATAELRRAAASPVQSDLRLFTIAARLRPMEGAGGSPLGAALGRVAEATRDAIGRGAAAGALDEFIALIGHASEALAGAQGTTDAGLTERLESAASGLAALAVPAPAAPPAAGGPPRVTRPLGRAGAEAAHAADAEPTAEPAREAEPVREVEPVHAARPAEPTPPPVEEELGIAAGFQTFEAMIAEHGLTLTSLDELITSPSTLPAMGRVSARLAAAAAAFEAAADVEPAAVGRQTAPRAHPAPESPIVPIEDLAPPGEAILPIEALLYRGHSALRRALELKGEVDALAATAGHGDPRLAALLREVFDLVELGLDTGR